MDIFNFTAIGSITSCYKEKFGIPRQPNLVSSAQAELILNQTFTEESVRGLDDFSHIWISFVFHASFNTRQAQDWKPMVRPPRLGGNKKVGVFASRSMFRPNPMGLSVVELVGIDYRKSGVVLKLRGSDLMDGTPVLDIKPYLPYADAIPKAKGGFAQNNPEIKYVVEFSEKAKHESQQASERLAQNIELLIQQILQLDPRPSYQQRTDESRVYSMRLCDFDLKWVYLDDNQIKVLALLS
ncbi:MAG TPA: tRNA (N6-threonylcarbamoyladenosine(37)-N6)-methyltransferase TrmO [Leucothrix sp.]|nr:tRNA (N6-threonylcarbamoyladenosine(37)-N6)-methyltransferase TrmO [Leucothrix sp.]